MDTPKRAGSTVPSPTDPKRIKLAVPPQSQGASPVDPENAPGKRSELDPLTAAEIGNMLSGAGPSGPERSTRIRQLKDDADDEDRDMSRIRPCVHRSTYCAR